MKVTLRFDLDEPGDREAFQQHTKTEEVFLLLWDIEQEVFRPARKHGYSGLHSARLNKLLEIDEVAEAIKILEELYFTKKGERLNVD